MTACAVPEDPSQEHHCEEASDRLGHRACVHRIDDVERWAELTLPSENIQQIRSTKFLFPAHEQARLPPLFLDLNNEDWHHDLLVEGFPDSFAGMTVEEYERAILSGAQREFYAGALVEYLIAGDTVAYGYNVWDDVTQPEWGLTCEQALDVEDTMNDRFGPTPGVFIPFGKQQREWMRDCVPAYYDPDVGIDYEAYSVADGFGYVRRYRLPELAAATSDWSLDWKDVLILDDAPLDIETVVSGVVTATRQSELSHLNVRSTARGTPNCYVQDAYALLEQWDGELVRLRCSEKSWDIRSATLAEAGDFWDQLRPEPVEVPEPDLEFEELNGLLDLPTPDAAQRASAVARYGSKGANLATLYQRIDGDLTFPGFVIPFAWYDRFMSSGTWTVDLGDGPSQHTFAETIEVWLEDPQFAEDGSVRRPRLEALRTAMEASPVDAQLLSELETWVQSTWGDETTMVRFRSSSNAEDSLSFSGAGLYSSTSACVADQSDGDTVGPSGCDADENDERDVRRGLTKVWASTWNMAAFEEREWFGIDHRAVAMGILVNTRSKAEQANVVAFTGQPNNLTDPRWLVNAQAGELDVVGAPAGVLPERVLLTMDDGTVTNIQRVSPSTELPAGEWVLSAETLEQLGAALSVASEVFPLDVTPPAGTTVLWDTEWKLTSAGRLVIKQIRPTAFDQGD
jgi:hypothetical protein